MSSAAEPVITGYSVRSYRRRGDRHGVVVLPRGGRTIVELSTTNSTGLPLGGAAVCRLEEDYSYKIGSTLATLRSLVEYVSHYGGSAKIERTETELVLRFPARWAEKSEVTNE